MGRPKLQALVLTSITAIVLLLREPALAKRFFELAAKASPEWYRPQLGIGSAGMI